MFVSGSILGPAEAEMEMLSYTIWCYYDSSQHMGFMMSIFKSLNCMCSDVHRTDLKHGVAERSMHVHCSLHVQCMRS